MCNEQQGKRHKYADILIAIANGVPVQILSGDIWVDYIPEEHKYVSPLHNLSAYGNTQYRIKPKPPVKKYQYAFNRRSKGIVEVAHGWYKDEADFINHYFCNEIGTPAFNWIQRIDASCKEFPA